MSDDDWQAQFCSLLDAHLLCGEMTQQPILPNLAVAALAIIITAGWQTTCLAATSAFVSLTEEHSEVSRELTPRDPRIVLTCQVPSLDQGANSCSQLLILNPGQVVRPSILQAHPFLGTRLLASGHRLSKPSLPEVLQARSERVPPHRHCVLQDASG